MAGDCTCCAVIEFATRSAHVSTVASPVWALSVAAGPPPTSSVLLDADALFTSVLPSTALDASFARITHVRLPPAASVTPDTIEPPANGDELVFPAKSASLHATRSVRSQIRAADSDASSGSLTDTACASDGPPFAAVTVYST